MKKTFLYAALGLMGIMGTLSIGVVNAEVSEYDVQNGSYTFHVIWNKNVGNWLLSGNGLYNNSQYGTLTVSGFTIMDRNLGASDVWNYTSEWSEIAEANIPTTYGYYYQRGNNYGFAANTSITVSSSRVNGPTYPYSSSTWINYNWGSRRDDTSNGNNLWGDETNTEKARKGPCPDGFHVPSSGEWNALIRTVGVGGNGYKFAEILKLPPAGLRNYDTTFYNAAYRGSYWSSTPSSSSGFAYRMDLNGPGGGSPKIYVSANDRNTKGYSIRCFKNVELAPSTFTISFTGSGQGSISTGSIEAEEGASISRDDGVGTVTISGTVVATGIANEGYVFSGWLTDCAGPTVTAACSFTGEFKPIAYSVHFTGTDVSGAMSNQSFTYDVTGTLTANAFTKTGYTFSGWTDGTTGYTDGQEVSNLTTIDGDTVTLTAEWTANTYTVKFDAGEGNGTMDDQEFVYGVAQALTGNKFTRDGYTFSGWTDGINVYTDKQNVNNLTGTNGATITLTAQWIQNTPSGDSSSAGGSSGGGGSRKASSTNDSSKSTDSQTGNETDSSINASDSEEDTQDSDKTSEGQNQGKTYSDEMKKAYEFAYKHGITTMPTIEEADMEGPLTRIAMAKMLSQYAMNVLGQKPANIIVPKFKDVSDELDAQYDYGVSLAYQLGIMGINMKNNRFRPNDLVTRGEFATALSRMLYKIADGTDKYYSTHLAKLMEEKIITNDDPMMKELRGYVMIMLMRSAEDK